MYEKLSSVILESALNNVTLVISITVSLLAIFRYIHKSFAYDSFDILFQPKDKRQGILHIKQVSVTVLICFILSSILFLYGFAFVIFELELQVYFLFFLGFALSLPMLAYITWKLIFKNPNNREKLIKIRDFICLFLFILLGAALSCTLFSKTKVDDSAKIVFHSEDIPTIFFVILISFFTFWLLQSSSKKKNFKYIFIGTYTNRMPCDLYLDYVVDTGIHILSSGNDSYKAIKYIQNDSDFSYTIELYKKVDL